MPWREILLALIRCELKAQYDGGLGWCLSAKGALAVVLVAIAVVKIWVH